MRNAILFSLFLVLNRCFGLSFIDDRGMVWEYEQLNFSGVTLLRCASPMTNGEVDLPARINGHTVLAIGSGFMSNTVELASISIPDAVTRIEASAFAGCTNLKRVMLPQNLESIGDHAFEGDVSLQRIVLPKNLRQIGAGAFLRCMGLATVISSSRYLQLTKGSSSYGYVSYYADNVLNLDSYSSEASWKDNVGNTWNFMFSEDYESITVTGATLAYSSSRHVDVPREIVGFPVRKLGKNSTVAASSRWWPTYYMRSITIPDTVSEIASSAFSGCTDLQSLEVEAPSLKIGDSAFYNARALVCVLLSGDVESVGIRAFEGCDNLSLFIVEGGIRRIGSGAFRNCAQLSGLRMGIDLVEDIGAGAFQGCTSLKDYGGLRFESVFKHCWCGSTESLQGDIQLPSTVLMISADAMSGGGEVSSIRIPSSVTQIEVGSFAGKDLTLQVDAGNEFYCSDALGALYSKDMSELFHVPNGVGSYSIPDSVRSIRAAAFEDNDLREIYIPATVSVIDSRSFLGSCCRISVDMDNAIYSSDAQGWLYSRDGKKLKHAPSDIVNAIVPLGVAEISAYAFYRCKELEHVVFPASLSKISSSAFSGCTKLGELLFPDKLENIEDSAFYANGTLSNVVFSTFLTNVGSRAFCRTKLDRVKIATKGSLYLDNWAFMDCSSLISVEIKADQIKTHWPFDSCTGLQKVRLDGRVISLGTWTFMDCSSLSNVVLSGQSITCSSGFYNCCKTGDITVPEEYKEASWLPSGWNVHVPGGSLFDIPVVDGGMTTESITTFLSSIFGKDSDIVRNVRTEAEIRSLESFLEACDVEHLDALSAAQRKWIYRSYMLSKVTTSPSLYESEPKLVLSEVGFSEFGLSLSVSLQVGEEKVGLSHTRLAEKIRVGKTLESLNEVPNILCMPDEDGNSLTFVLDVPERKQGFVQIRID